MALAKLIEGRSDVATTRPVGESQFQAFDRPFLEDKIVQDLAGSRGDVRNAFDLFQERFEFHSIPVEQLTYRMFERTTLCRSSAADGQSSGKRWSDAVPGCSN